MYRPSPREFAGSPSAPRTWTRIFFQSALAARDSALIAFRWDGRSGQRSLPRFGECEKRRSFTAPGCNCEFHSREVFCLPIFFRRSLEVKWRGAWLGQGRSRFDRQLSSVAPGPGERVCYEITTGVTNSKTTSKTPRVPGINWVNVLCT